MKYQDKINFLPNGYIKNQRLKKEQKNKNGIYLILILILVFASLDFYKIKDYINIQKDKESIITENNTEEFIHKDVLLNWVKISEDINCSVDIDNGRGILIIDDLDKIDSLSKYLEIIEIKNTNKGFEVEVLENEK